MKSDVRRVLKRLCYEGSNYGAKNEDRFMNKRVDTNTVNWESSFCVLTRFYSPAIRLKIGFNAGYKEV
jgi:hypothetical protein